MTLIFKNKGSPDEITLCNWDQLNMQLSDKLFKPNIKVYGIIYWENKIKDNYEPKIQKYNKEHINGTNNTLAYLKEFKFWKHIF